MNKSKAKTVDNSSIPVAKEENKLDNIVINPKKLKGDNRFTKDEVYDSIELVLQQYKTDPEFIRTSDYLKAVEMIIKMKGYYEPVRTEQVTEMNFEIG